MSKQDRHNRLWGIAQCLSAGGEDREELIIDPSRFTGQIDINTLAGLGIMGIDGLVGLLSESYGSPARDEHGHLVWRRSK